MNTQMVAATLAAVWVTAVVAGEPELNAVKLPDKARAQQISDMKFGMFVCWSFSSVSGQEWTREPHGPEFFDVTGCDTDQWCQVAKADGMNYILFLSKHHDGFCLWDTETTDLKVTGSPLGIDVLAKLRSSCNKHGIKLALYYSEGDWRHPRNTPEEVEQAAKYKKAQLKELCTQYGSIEFFWMDHAACSDGGLSHAETVEWIHRFQPNCFVGFNHGEPAGRLCLRERGTPGKLGDPETSKYNKEAEVTYQGYHAAEFTYPISQTHWFDNPAIKPETFHTPEKIYADYLGAVKFGNIFSLDVGPSPEGKLRARDVQILKKVGQMIRAETTGGIPFEAALDDARVELSSLASGQRESLMLGNGDLYGIVWEQNDVLTMRVTKNDIWDARVDTSKDGPLPRVDIHNNTVTGPKGAPPSYKKPYPQPRCAAVIRIGAEQPNGGAKSAVLDLRHAVANIRRSEPTKVRILADRNVVFFQTAEPVSLEVISADTLPAAKTGKTGDIAWLHQKLPPDTNGDWEGMEYALAVAVKEDMKAVSLVSSHDLTQGNVLEGAIALARDTLHEPEIELITAHERIWHEFWSRSGIELADKQMQRWWYRMLYFAGNVCKPGTAPVGLMPPLATDATPWHADYHHNYNSWQAFWPLPASNHPELSDPWISYVNDMLPRFRYLAKVTYGCEGVFFPISSFLNEPDPAICNSNNKRQMSMNPWGLTIGLVGMTIQSMWQRHLCDPDPAYLEAKIYPTLREGARFYVSFMAKCSKEESGYILLGSSYSPEHGEWGIANCPFDIAYVHYTFDAFIQAASELDRDADLVAQCRQYKQLLGTYPTTMHEGQEIVVDWKGGEHIGVHNITVPAAPVFPADQVTWFSPEPEKALFRRTIKATRFNGNNSHVMFNIAKARLSMPEGYGDARKWFASRELPNGLFIWQGHAHGTFMGEMIGIAGLIDEFLLQSVGNKIRLFPCWPSDQDAQFTRLRAQGGFIVSAEFKDGRVAAATIESVANKPLRLLCPWKTVYVNGKETAIGLDGLVNVDTQPGQLFEFSESGE